MCGQSVQGAEVGGGRPRELGKVGQGRPGARQSHWPGCWEADLIGVEGLGMGADVWCQFDREAFEVNVCVWAGKSIMVGDIRRFENPLLILSAFVTDP